MKMPRGSIRWLVPAAIVAGTTAAVAIPSLLPAGADPVPVLPELTAAQLLTKVQQADVRTFSGSISATVDLGLPDLGALGGSSAAPASVLELLSGTTRATVAVDGPDRQKVALDGDRSETAWVHDGTDVWSWDSTTSRVVHLDLAGLGDVPARAAEHAGGAVHEAMPAITPETAADELLARVGTSTEIRVQTPGYVAGRPVYELVLDPIDEASTVQDVVIAVDASTGMALRLRVDAVGSDTPALEIGFTSISYDRPPADTFTFTPPPGAEVVQADSPADLLPFSRFGGGGRRGGPGADPAGDDAPTAGLAGTMPAELADAAAGDVPDGMERVGEDWSAMAVVSAADVPPLLRPLLADAPTVAGPGGEAKVLRTRLLNLLLLADGRLVVAALDPAAMAARIPA